MGTYVWNAEGELKTAGGVTYTYDGDGRRVQKSNGKLYWYGGGSNVLDETDATGSSGNATFSEYIFFAGDRIARRDYQNNVFYYFADQINSSRVIAEIPSGGSTDTLCYDADFYPFGGEDIFTNTCSQNYKWTGKERDAETGNDDFDARYYSSVYGRFLSADWSAVPAPVPYANLTNPQTLNLYAIVRDNPESYADLDGHCDAPTGLKPGQVGVCVASYIKTKWFHFPGRGDGRNTNPRGGTSRVETRLVVDPKQHTVTQTYDHVGRSGIVGQDFGLKGSGGSTVSKPTVDEKGDTHFQVAQHGESAMTKTGLIEGTIDNHVNLDVSANGDVNLDPGSTARNFPSLEGYSYTVDDKGNIASHKIIDKTEASTNDENGDLTHPEQPIH